MKAGKVKGKVKVLRSTEGTCWTAPPPSQWGGGKKKHLGSISSKTSEACTEGRIKLRAARMKYAQANTYEVWVTLKSSRSRLRL